MQKLPRVGDRVVIPLGSGEVEAEVVYVYDIFSPPRVEVEFFLDKDDDEPVRAGYPVDRIRRAPVSA